MLRRQQPPGFKFCNFALYAATTTAAIRTRFPTPIVATPGSTPPVPDGGDTPGCKSCLQDIDCETGSVCAQFGGDSFCARSCSTGSDCSADTSCTSVSGADGTQTKACIPRADVCGGSVGPGGSGGGGGGGGPLDAGGPVVGAVGASGGTLSRLYFAVIGDTRPPIINDTKAYPTQVITTIYSELEALSPRPPFAVSTGDYLFSTANGTQATPQLDLYLAVPYALLAGAPARCVGGCSDDDAQTFVSMAEAHVDP